VLTLAPSFAFFSWGARKEGSCRATPGKRVRRDKRNRATGERTTSDKFQQEQTAMLRDMICKSKPQCSSRPQTQKSRHHPHVGFPARPVTRPSTTHQLLAAFSCALNLLAAALNILTHTLDGIASSQAKRKSDDSEDRDNFFHDVILSG
jgi:hypothetical protein